LGGTGVGVPILESSEEFFLAGGEELGVVEPDSADAIRPARHPQRRNGHSANNDEEKEHCDKRHAGSGAYRS
jgi:hypothetical protein